MENTCTGSRESNVSQEIEQARNTVTNLEESINTLAERLKVVSLPSEKTACEPEAKQTDRQRCQIDSAIRSITERLQSQIERIISIEGELQI